jgi:hypothetical protein
MPPGSLTARSGSLLLATGENLSSAQRESVIRGASMTRGRAENVSRATENGGFAMTDDGL